MTTEKKIDLFLEFLRNELFEQRITVAEFAKRMGATRNGVHKWLKRENIMGLDKYFKALEVLNVTEEDVLNFKPKK